MISIRAWRRRRLRARWSELKNQLQGSALFGAKLARWPPPDMSLRTDMHRAHRAAVYRGERIERRLMEEEDRASRARNEKAVE